LAKWQGDTAETDFRIFNSLWQIQVGFVLSSNSPHTYFLVEKRQIYTNIHLKGIVNYIQFEYSPHKRTEDDFQFLGFFVDVKIMKEQMSKVFQILGFGGSKSPKSG
jgi:hypothetical protein